MPSNDDDDDGAVCLDLAGNSSEIGMHRRREFISYYDKAETRGGDQ